MADETSDSIKPWTIRGVAPEERNAAIEAAKRTGMTLSKWLSRAIRTEIQQERQASRAPVPVAPDGPDGQARLSDVERIAAFMRDLAAAGLSVSKAHAGQVTRALVALLPARPTGRTRASDKPATVPDVLG